MSIRDRGAEKAFRRAEQMIEKARRSGEPALDLRAPYQTAKTTSGLIELPESLGKLTRLHSLKLDRNQLTALPEWLGQLTQLRELSLSNNRLTLLPDSLGGLTQLHSLELSGNKLTVLPDSLGRLSKLLMLTISGNALTALPESFGQLKSLLQLHVFNNRLSVIPEWIGKLTTLRGLSLDENHFTAVPENLGQLTELTTLYLNDNQLTALPDSLRRLTKLESLFLHGNPALGIPAEVLGPKWQDLKPDDAGKRAKPAAILDYYFAIKNRGGRALREVKLIFVGRGEVGKSSMVDVLRRKKFVRNRKRTDGISITQWPVKLPDGKATMLMWDFGGQEIMHGTHQFFLTHRSLYVVMVDGRHDRGKQDAEYWLKLVRAFGGDSSVLVVMNRQKAHPFDVDRQYLAGKYGVKLEDFFRTDCSRPKDIAPLRKAILAESARMLANEEKFPAKCWAVKTRLSEMKKHGEDYLSEDSYAKLCAALGVPDAEEQQKLLRRLADLGTVVSFPDDVKLSELTVLNPEWATDGIYRVVTNEALREEKHGQLKRTLLRKLLPKERWPQPKHIRYLLDLMEKFELCFAVEDDGETVLVPELLPDVTPPMPDWNPAECLVFVYQYSVLPHGILPRFITRTHTLSTGRERWRTGVELADDGAEALVKADYEANCVSVWVRGDFVDARRALLKVVRHHFDRIHLRINDLNPEERVAMPGHPEVLVSYRDLVLDERRGKETVAVTIAGERTDKPIAELLNGVESAAERRRQTRLRQLPARNFYLEPGAHYHEHEESMNSDDHSTNIRGSNYGQAGGQGNTQNITDSFKAIQGVHGNELLALFQQLNEQLLPLKDEMKGKDIKVLEEHSSKLVAEAQKPKGEEDKSVLTLSAKGVIEAAKTVGAIASPVIATTKAILQFYGIPLP